MKALLALLALGKLGKVLTTAGTMLLSVAVYATTYGWRFAVGLVALIFVHEMGHFMAARGRGLAVGAPVFIPFVGAWISLKDSHMDAETEAHVAMAGPVVGTAGAFACYLWAIETREPFWWAMAYTGFLINLFNLIPLKPLDGGRVVGVLSPKMWLIGMPLLGAVFLWRPSPLILLVALMAAPEVIAAWRGTLPARPVVAPDVRLRFAVGYAALVAVLAVLALDVHERMHAA